MIVVLVPAVAVILHIVPVQIVAPVTAAVEVIRLLALLVIHRGIMILPMNGQVVSAQIIFGTPLIINRSMTVAFLDTVKFITLHLVKFITLHLTVAAFRSIKENRIEAQIKVRTSAI